MDKNIHKIIDFKILTTTAKPPRLSYATKMVGAELEWLETKGAGIKVAVLDTGADTKHPDLQHLAGAVDMTGQGPEDKNGHGTWCCGAVGARGRMVGVAPECDLYSVKVVRNDGYGYSRDIIAGLEWCLSNGIDVISMSLGGPKPAHPRYHEVVRELYRGGALIITAAGNYGEQYPDDDTVMYPAGWPECCAVIAVDITKDLAEFSSRGAQAEIGAAGVDVWGLWPDNQYVKISGTSMATPVIAGAGALLQARSVRRHEKKAPPDVLRWFMQFDAEDLGEPGRDREFGYGVFSFARFVDGDLALERPSIDLRFEVGSKKYWRNGVERTGYTAPFVDGGHTYLGLDDVGEALGCRVEWVPPKTINIKG
ncbi:MAG: S8 family serine peptidase [Firmicutes bacterium]|nr:S8 family serine peptidase [Bacillota bacterium]